MGAKNVDIVFVIDASGSMAPCISNVIDNIGRMLDSLNQAKFNVRLDAVVQKVVGTTDNGVTYATNSLRYGGMQLINELYKKSGGAFFTADVNEFKSCLNAIKVSGDEDMLLALDFALDYPFGPAMNTQRVIVLMSDEPFETNFGFNEHAMEYAAKADKMVDKIMARHVSLFMVMPSSRIADTLAEADRSDYAVLQNANDGLKTFDFARFFEQLGKTISVTTAQQSREKPYERALFGQDGFSASDGCNPVDDVR